MNLIVLNLVFSSLVGYQINAKSIPQGASHESRVKIAICHVADSPGKEAAKKIIDRLTAAGNGRIDELIEIQIDLNGDDSITERELQDYLDRLERNESLTPAQADAIYDAFKNDGGFPIDYDRFKNKLKKLAGLRAEAFNCELTGLSPADL